MKLSNETLELMEKLTQAYGIPGQERMVTGIIETYYRRYADEVFYDNLGSIYAHKKSKTPGAVKLMINGHCDEVGLMVRQVRPNGTLTFIKAGGIDEQCLYGARATLITLDNRMFKGYIGAPSPKIRARNGMANLNADNLTLDIGFTSEEQVRAAGIMEGDMIVLDGEFKILNDGQRILSKAWDDRYGCILGIELLRELQGKDLDFDLYVVANVQEEVGLRGAAPAARMVEPDVSVVLDCTAANDIELYTSPYAGIGHGIMVRFFDRTYVPNRRMIRELIRICQENNIPFQHHQSFGGTDSGAINYCATGIPALPLCICTRNIHTASSIIDVDDYLGARKALITFVKEFSAEKAQYYKENNRMSGKEA